MAEADLAASQADARPCFESLAINDLLTGGEWQQGRVTRLSKSTHINIKETLSLAKEIAADAVAFPGCRELYISDS